MCNTFANSDSITLLLATGDSLETLLASSVTALCIIYLSFNTGKSGARALSDVAYFNGLRFMGYFGGGESACQAQWPFAW